MTNRSETEQDNRTILRKLVGVAVFMFGFGWALVPLYQKICEVTGINVVTSRDAEAERAARNTQVDTSRTVVVEFDANSHGPWRFRPHVNHVTVHPGELVHVDYDLVNLESRTMVGQAIPSYAPMQSAAYFQKLECFCFKQQTLAANCRHLVKDRVLLTFLRRLSRAGEERMTNDLRANGQRFQKH